MLTTVIHTNGAERLSDGKAMKMSGKDLFVNECLWVYAKMYWVGWSLPSHVDTL